MRKHVAVFALGAIASVASIGWLRSYQPVTITPMAFQETAQPAGIKAPITTFGGAAIRYTAENQSSIVDVPLVDSPFKRSTPQPVARLQNSDAAVINNTPAPSVAAPANPPVATPAPATSGPITTASNTPAPVPAAEDRPILKQRTEEQIEHDREAAVQQERNRSAALPAPRPPDQPKVVTSSNTRSTKQSALIIAGGAAAGAAIGGMAGRGKGAAIGAIAGGAGGYVYDRMTRNRNSSYSSPTSGGGSGSPWSPGGIAQWGTWQKVGAGTAVGAALGGMTGGGKGAAIGAVTGGAAGYIYDRYSRTH